MSVGPEAEQVAAAFIEAVVGGDLQAMLDVLAPDVVLLSDGGGVVSAARRPILGPDKVARFLAGVVPKAGDIEITWCTVNGTPSAMVTAGETVLGVGSCLVVDDKVTAIHFVLNPEKLGRLRAEAPLSRV
jgi:RNA polymerase sigma-70 factor (ECF subfamily)